MHRRLRRLRQRRRASFRPIQPACPARLRPLRHPPQAVRPACGQTRQTTLARQAVFSPLRVLNYPNHAPTSANLKPAYVKPAHFGLAQNQCRTSRRCTVKLHLSSRLRLLRFLHQTFDRRRQLCANALPIRQAILSDTQRLTLRSDRVVETNALDEAAVTTVTRIGCDDVVERALLRAATSQADDNHTGILENRGSKLLKRAIIAGNRKHNKHLAG